MGYPFEWPSSIVQDEYVELWCWKMPSLVATKLGALKCNVWLLLNFGARVTRTDDSEKSEHHLVELLMRKWGLKCIKLRDGFSFVPPYKAFTSKWQHSVDRDSCDLNRKCC
ncbi:hypothetical protein TanjilG_22861 [Lupinus angustifolius]|uniref:Uncharacterized protein n=1 Tax=Lupinus angustifolius TaxID=3871 RepID=A0A4P1RHS5_LUPAN|nr:hypothetical protein TanjilG_22861 [Lupinus angustifolius]